MTTDDLIRLIEQDAARHRHPDHDPRQEHFGYPCWPTIGSLFSLAGVPRRSIEEAIHQARLEGVPIVTEGDGGVRVARSADEAEQQARALFDRIRAQRLTAARVLLASRRMRREEDAAIRPPAVLFPELETAA